jgi:hypothetical protein
MKIKTPKPRRRVKFNTGTRVHKDKRRDFRHETPPQEYLDAFNNHFEPLTFNVPDGVYEATENEAEYRWKAAPINAPRDTQDS